MFKLNVGCGEKPKRGYFNIDLYARRADQRMDCRRLEFHDYSVDAVVANQVIEHIGYIGATRFLSEAFRVLKRGERLTLETPDVEKSFCEFVRAKPKRKEALMNWIYGLEFPGYQHVFCFPFVALEELLKKIGFVGIRKKSTMFQGFPAYRVECLKPENDEPYQTLTLVRRKATYEPKDFEGYLKALDLEKKCLWKAAPYLKKYLENGKETYLATALRILGTHDSELRDIAEPIILRRLSGKRARSHYKSLNTKQKYGG